MIQKELEVISTSYHFGTTFGTKKKNNKKITQAGGVGNQHLPLVLSTFLWQNLQIFGTKLAQCRRFLQHYYRDTFIESHRKPIEVPQISYRGRLAEYKYYDMAPIIEKVMTLNV